MPDKTPPLDVPLHVKYIQQLDEVGFSLPSSPRSSL